MKTGEIASILSVTRDTINNWVKNPALEEFFSALARGEAGNAHRFFSESDVLVLNTIHHLRRRGTRDWEAIAEYLDSGERFQEFPQNAISTDPRTIPLPQAEQSVKAAATLAERDAALNRVQELEYQLDTMEQRHIDEVEKLRIETREEVRRSRQEYEQKIDGLQREVRQLLREIGRLEGRIEERDNHD